MEKVYDKKFGTSYRPNCAAEYLELLCDIAVDYDGCNTVESLKGLVDELKGYAHKARTCLHEGRLFDNRRKQTNFDRIKAMSVEEMAEFIVQFACSYEAGTSPWYVDEWLESEVED